MSDNQRVIDRFYTAFRQLDYKGMLDCYNEDAVFNDPVFGLLDAEATNAMWEMLCKRAKDFSLTFSNIQLLDEEYATCDWIASYTFSQTGNKVVNHVKAFMRLKDGKIIEHSDAFRLSTWIGQALGWKGVLFGWTGFMKRAVQKKARKSLHQFMQKKNAGNV